MSAIVLLQRLPGVVPRGGAAQQAQEHRLARQTPPHIVRSDDQLQRRLICTAGPEAPEFHDSANAIEISMSAALQLHPPLKSPAVFSYSVLLCHEMLTDAHRYAAIDIVIARMPCIGFAVCWWDGLVGDRSIEELEAA